jgi:hypothetical protein
MNLVTALAVVIGVMGAIATWLVLGPLSAINLQIWVIFIAWACFYHCGGAEAGLKNTIVNMIWGAIMAQIALLLVAKIGGGSTVVIGIIVGVTLAIMIAGAQVPLISVIPAAVYGYAVTAAYGLLASSNDPWGIGSLAPFVYVVISAVVGAILGYISQKIAASLAKE